jgi:hypothetical protein
MTFLIYKIYCPYYIYLGINITISLGLTLYLLYDVINEERDNAILFINIFGVYSLFIPG